MSAIVALTVFVAGYAAIASEKINRAAVALIGAGLLLVLRIVDAEDVFRSERFGIDWNVIFLLLGMMVIVGAIGQTGLFDYLAVRAVQLTRGKPFRLMVSLLLLTALASALVDNVTTVLLVAPMTIAITRELGLPPIPFLIAEALASNIGGTATLIGDPPNIIIGSQADLSYLDFLVHLAPLIVILLVVFAGMCRIMFGKQLTYDQNRVAKVMATNARRRLHNRSMLIWSLAVLGVVTILFVLHGVLHYEPSIVALLGAGVLLLAAGDHKPLMREVEWETLAFFGGLFIMVGALAKVGVIGSIADGLAGAIDGKVFLGAALITGASAVLSAIVDNIPYVATMAPIVHTIANTLPAGVDAEPLWWALALGADLGGNATPIGASANIVVLAVAAKHGHRITFGQFVRYGVPTTIVTIALAVTYIWVRYFLMA